MNRARGQWKWWLGGCVALIGLTLLLPIIAVAAFYIEEDWRGAATWNKTKAEVVASGVAINRDDYVPALIPDSENFGALPIFQTTADSGGSYLTAKALKNALEPVTSRLAFSKDQKKPDGLPYLEKWEKGEVPDMGLMRSRLAKICKSVHPDAILPGEASATDLFAVLCPALPQLRAENMARPKCRFEMGYDTEPAIHISFGPAASNIKLIEVLAYEQRLALYENKGDVALEDFAVNRKLIIGLKQEPLLISGFVAVGLSEIEMRVVQEGLARHAWTDAQLAQLDADFGNLDFLTSGRFWIAGDVVFFNIPSAAYYEKHRNVTVADIAMLKGKLPTDDDKLPSQLERVTYWLTPRGWFDLDHSDYARFHLLGTVKLLDPVNRRVYPEKQPGLLDSLNGKYSHVFWSVPLADGVTVISGSVKTFAYAQVHVDEARIACRLERYRLTHGVYPESLDMLTPEYGAYLPHDVMNGEAYHYAARPDGTYLLYSVAWNQQDDSGDGSQPSGKAPKDAADWVWPSNYEKKGT